jgi:diguanylate cyclase (GGDEF)-like protein
MLLNLVSLYLFIAVLLSMFLAAYVQSRNGAIYTKCILFLSIAVSIYMLGYAFELNAAFYERALFWNKIEYFGIPFVSALWLTIALMYTGYFFPVKKWLLAAIFVIPMITFVARFTNDVHHLYFSSTSYIYDNKRFLLIKEMGPLNYLQAVHSISMIIISVFVLIRTFITNREIMGPKIKLMLMASFFAVVGMLMSIVNPLNINIDFMVIFLPITCIMVITAIIKYDFLEIKTIARNIIFENSSDAMVLINHNQILIDYNQSAKKFFNNLGIKLNEISVNELLMPCGHIQDAFKCEGPNTFEIEDHGVTKYYNVITEQIGKMSNGGRGTMKIIRDITEYYEMNETLKKQATTDELSSTLNRRAFMEIGKKFFSDQRQYDIGLMMIDIDHFKGINDSYGHGVGDEVIRTFGKLLNRNFREGDVIARLGGEEFAVLMENKSIEAIYKRANLFRQVVEDYQYKFDRDGFNITVSIGIAKGENQIDSFDDLLNQADMAMYQAKVAGRNQVMPKYK